MSVQESIQFVYKDLKPVQKRIADYTLHLDFDGLNAPIDEYAKKIGTSVASISRFCAKIGYDSFQTLKISRSRELGHEPQPVPALFSPDDYPELSIRKVFSEAVSNLRATEERLDFPSIERVADRILSSDRLFFLGMGGSGGVSILGQIMFSHIGFDTTSVNDPYSMLVCAGHVDSRHTVLGLSHSGATKNVMKALSIARERGAFTVGITNYPKSPLAELAEVTLNTACHEHSVHFAKSNSMAVQMTIIRALYILVASRGGEAIDQGVARIEESVRRNLRIKNTV